MLSRPRDLIQDGRWIFSFIILTFIYLVYRPCFYHPQKSQIITKLDFFTLPTKMQKLVLINNSKAFQEFISEYINLVSWSCFMMYTSMTGIVYIYRNNTILSYSLMCSTHTTRPKIKIIKIHLTIPSPAKIYHPHPILQIVPNLHTINQNNQNKFETEFDRTLVYQRKINFLTILKYQFSPKITYPNHKIPCKS